MQIAKQRMTPRQRILAALHGEPTDQVPFTCYSLFLKRGERERRLREAGVALIERLPAVSLEARNVRVVREQYWEEGIQYSRHTWQTPVGNIYSTTRPQTAYDTGSSWTLDYLIKRPEDYAVVEYVVRDTVVRPRFEAIRAVEQRLGEDGFVSAGMASLFTNPESASLPMHQMLYYLLGPQQFAVDLYERQADFLALHDLLWQKHRQVYPLLAEVPCQVVMYGGNIDPGMIGPRRFAEFYLPCWEELAKFTRPAGKLIGCHLDANTRALRDLIAKSAIDVVEAFTPAPFCDMTVAEARESWPGKVLWVNFPSDAHLASTDEIRAETRRIVAESAPGERFIFGVTENVPENVIWTSLETIAATLQELSGSPQIDAVRSAWGQAERSASASEETTKNGSGSPTGEQDERGGE